MPKKNRSQKLKSHGANQHEEKALRELFDKQELPPSTKTPRKNAVADIDKLMSSARSNRQERWQMVEDIMDHLLEKDYTVLAFNDDLVNAFPELSLYSSGGGTSSGRSGAIELERTRGAFFAIFWLLRTRTDGRRGFCFGVDEHGQTNMPLLLEDDLLSLAESTDIQAVSSMPDMIGSPISPRASSTMSMPHDGESLASTGGAKSFFAMSDAEKRAHFYHRMPWDNLRALLIQARIVNPDCTIERSRLRTLLVLTAIHDICKIEDFWPTVAEGEFYGYQRGDIIHDHDIALAYILTRHPHVLPSFYDGLPRESQRTIIFTQSKLNFNHGWLVQGEAPPGPLFHSFKELVRAQDVVTSDLAFYFVHWLTDLAGAEPTPFQGAEKFVLKLPHQCLLQFIKSFPFVSDLSTKSETEVYEQYLRYTWHELQSEEPTFHDVPDTIESICLFRLLLHAQCYTTHVFEAFKLLSQEQRHALSLEMAHTGIGQAYSCGEKSIGPSILVYYAPAFLQKYADTVDHAVACLQILSKIYAQGRHLFPTGDTLSDTGNMASVTVSMESLKAQETIESIVCEDAHASWVLLQISTREANVVLLPKTVLSDPGTRRFQALCFSNMGCQ